MTVPARSSSSFVEGEEGMQRPKSVRRIVRTGVREAIRMFSGLMSLWISCWSER